MSVTPALRTPKKDDKQIMAMLVYMLNSMPPELNSKTLFPKQGNK